MKRFFAFVFFLAMTVIFIPGLHARADQVDVYENDQLVKSVVFKIGVPYYVVNNQTPGVKMDVAPFLQNDRTFVPVRFLGNALGVSNDQISWDNPTQTATLKGAKAVLKMTIGKAEVTSNGQTKAIDVAPILIDPGRTMLPARFVAEGLGYQVDWDDTTQTVICWPTGEAKPDVSTAVDYLDGQVQTEPVQPPVTGETVNGYAIPADTDLNVSTTGYKNSGSIVFNILLKEGDLQQQYADAESILLQTVDADTAAEAIEYAKKMQDPILSPVPVDWPPITTFAAPNGMAVRVGAGGGYSIEFQLWPTK